MKKKNGCYELSFLITRRIHFQLPIPIGAVYSSRAKLRPKRKEEKVEKVRSSWAGIAYGRIIGLFFKKEKKHGMRQRCRVTRLWVATKRQRFFFLTNARKPWTRRLPHLLGSGWLSIYIRCECGDSKDCIKKWGCSSWSNLQRSNSLGEL